MRRRAVEDRQVGIRKAIQLSRCLANHLVRQVTGFRAFDKDAYKREDDCRRCSLLGAGVVG